MIAEKTASAILIGAFAYALLILLMVWDGDVRRKKKK